MNKLVFAFCLMIVCNLITSHSIAQCSGNILFKEDFGGNTSSPLSGTRLAASITSYIYDSLGEVNDGEYSIRKTSGDLATGKRQFGTWHIGNDHSGSGYMMVVNADYTAGKFYETTVSNLCSGSKLYFSAWIANLIPAGNPEPLDPILKFEIASVSTGTVLSTFVTTAVPRFSSFTWTQYGVNFTLPPGESSVILRIYNNQVGGGGNDLCLDDIEFTLCGPVMTPVITGVYPNTNDACAGSNISIHGNVAQGYYSTQAYQWQYNSGRGWQDIAGATTPDILLSNAQVGNSGSYRLLVAEQGLINTNSCRSVSTVIPLNIFNTVTPVLTANQLICEKDTLRISTSPNALQYRWMYGTTVLSASTNTLIIPKATLTDAGTYTLQVVTAGGCTSSSAITVAVKQNTLQKILRADFLLCDDKTFAADVQQPAATNYLWNDGNTSAKKIISAAGTYYVNTDDGVCKRSDTIIVSKNFTPTVSLGNDVLLCYNEQLTLNPNATNADTYLWNNGSTADKIDVSAAGMYSVNVFNKCGIATDEISVDFQECADKIFVPSAFTPNSDGLNDVLKAIAYFRIESLTFTIYNRWGEKVFSSNSLLNGWDGTFKGQKADVGNYIWTVQYKRNDKIYKQKGTVLLVY